MNQIVKHLSELDEALSYLDQRTIVLAANVLKHAKSEGGSVYLVGNGGSASTCSHFANDLHKMCGMNAISLPDMTSLTLAFGNDNGWNNMFALPLKRMMKPEDVLVAITFSGESINVVRALEGDRVRILLTGPAETSSAIMTRPNVLIRAMAQEITVAEDIHSIVCHAIARELAHG